MNVTMVLSCLAMTNRRVCLVAAGQGNHQGVYTIKVCILHRFR